MRILHVITSLEIGGAQRLLADLLPLQASSVEVSLLVYERVNNDFEKVLEQAGINIICFNVHNFHNPGIIFRLRRFFKDYDLIHAHLFPTIYWASLAARGLNVKLVYTEHSTSNSRRNKWYFHPIERFMYGRYDKIISISQQTQDALTSWLGQHDNRFVVINNGVDTEKFASVKVPVVPKSLIMVSRFAPSKDQETVIRAMVNIDKEATLLFVGDGENRHHCEVLAKELGVSRSSVNAWEMGISTPSVERIVDRSNYFRVTVDYLLGLDDKVNIDISSLSEEAKAAILKVIEIFLEKK